MSPAASVNLADPGLLEAYITSASLGLLAQSYSNLLAAQQQLELSQVDSGIAVKIEAYQRQMNGQARYYQQETLPGLIHLFTYGSNFYALVSAFNRLLAGASDADVLGNPKTWADQVDAIADQAASYQLSAKGLDVRFRATQSLLAPLMQNYDQTVGALEKELSTEAKSQSALIDTLNKQIAANIQSIVDEGGKAGEGVSQLGRGIVTALQIGQTPSKDKDKSSNKGATAAKPKTGKSEAPSSKPSGGGDKGKTLDQQTEYLISAIDTIRSGVSGSSQAVRDLRANNEKLGQAYQDLAATQGLLAVAKSVQAQNELFADTYASLTKQVATLPQLWQQVTNAFQAAVPVVAGVSNVDALRSLKRTVALAAQSWQQVSDQIDSIKQSYAGNGALPNN